MTTIHAWDVRAACTGLHRAPTGGYGLTVEWLTAQPSACRSFAVVYAFVSGDAPDPVASFRLLLENAGADDVQVQRCVRAHDVEHRAGGAVAEMLSAFGGAA